ncbi:RICIN domain-containing protein [Streptomyces sp. NPDC051016]|uniref:RICIN domain-containing protein n=1 Tax=Streptomyces sp. NPDC051016 TaxID=3365638 RepID=UPI0037BB4DF3
MAFSFANTSSASALTLGDVIGTNFLRNWATGRCLDSDASGNVYTNPCQQGNDYQTWTLTFVGHVGYDIVQVKNQATGRCLYWGNLDGARYPYTSDCFPGAAAYTLMTWLGVGSGWDQVQFKTRQEGLCLDSNSSGSAYMLGCNGGGNQLWKLGY